MDAHGQWVKGWVQTWLVHMRQPRVLLNELGPSNFLLTQILFLGATVSAMVHPVMLATLVYAAMKVTSLSSLPMFEAAMFALCLLNLVLGYGAFLAIGHSTLAPRERAGLRSIVLMTPLYWVALSVAAWLAVWEIYRRPHHWNKTPHARARAVLPHSAGVTPQTHLPASHRDDPR